MKNVYSMFSIIHVTREEYKSEEIVDVLEKK